MKRLIVCCDGTWAKLRDPYPTNVVKLARAFLHEGKDGVSQLVYYDEGLGTNSVLDRLPGGAFGLGIGRDIRDAYAFLCTNYEKGDEIYLFGFSRGAYTVRCLAQMVGNYGILQRSAMRLMPQVYWYYRLPKEEDKEGKYLSGRKIKITRKAAKSIFNNKNNPFHQDYKEKFGQKSRFNKENVSAFLKDWLEDTLPSKTRNDVEITVLGCFDTVGQVGIPDVFDFLPFEIYWSKHFRQLGFHNNTVNEKVRLALHAVAMDEERRFLINTPMAVSACSGVKLKQFWFPGDHGSIGGGTAKNKLYQLSNIPLNWMLDEFDEDETKVCRKTLHEPDRFQDDDKICPLINFPKTPWWFKWLGLHHRRPIPDETEISGPSVEVPNQFHASVIERLAACKKYRNPFPRNLSRFRGDLEEHILQLPQPSDPH